VLGDYTVLVLVSAISNTPQLMILSLLCLAYNGLFTSLSLARVESLRARDPERPAYVERAQGKQRDKYFLQLPFRYGMPLLMGSILMHWLAGQSLFLVAIEFYETGPGGSPQSPPGDTVISGWSPLGITLVVVVGILMLYVLGIVSRRTLPTAMPVVAN
jgi:hypothetical protein